MVSYHIVSSAHHDLQQKEEKNIFAFPAEDLKETFQMSLHQSCLAVWQDVQGLQGNFPPEHGARGQPDKPVHSPFVLGEFWVWLPMLILI